MRPPSRFAAVLVLGALATAPPASGGCCDDVLSCAGAVASGGLTCAIEAALDVLRSLLDRVVRENDDSAKAFEADVAASVQETNAALDAWRKAARDAANDAAAALKTATGLAGDDRGRLETLAAQHANAPAGGSSRIGTSAVARVGGAATPTPAPGAHLGASSLQTSEVSRLLGDQSVEDVKKQIENENKSAKGSQLAAEAAAAKAQEAAENSAAWSRASFTTAFVVAMADLIVVIRNGITNPLGAVAAVTAAIAALSLIEKALNELQPALDQEAGKRADLADVPRPDVDQALAHAQKARDLLAKLEKMVRLQTALERQALSHAPLLATTPAPSAHVRLASAAASAAFLRGLKGRVTSLHTDAAKLATSRPADLAPFRSKLAAGLDGEFHGKTPAQAAARRDALLAEARRRYAFDPKTLAGVEKLVRDASLKL